MSNKLGIICEYTEFTLKIYKLFCLYSNCQISGSIKIYNAFDNYAFGVCKKYFFESCIWNVCIQLSWIQLIKNISFYLQADHHWHQLFQND